MNDIVINEGMEILNPLDPNYPAYLFKEGIKETNRKADEALEMIYDNIVESAPEAFQLKEAGKKGFRIVVDATDQFLDDVKEGKIKLVTSKDGKTFAQVRNSNGYFGEKIPVRTEEFAQGINSAQMANAFQMRAIEDKTEELEEQMVSLNGTAKTILQGQRNDRIGHYISGCNLYLQSRQVSNENLRLALVAESLKELDLAEAQLITSFQSDISYLESKEYNKERKNRTEKIDEKMNDINDAYRYINGAFIMKAAINCSEGELDLMAFTLQQHSLFIDNVVAPNIPMLIEHDIRDDGTINGVWKQRQKLKYDASELVASIKAPEKVLYLGEGEIQDEE